MPDHLDGTQGGDQWHTVNKHGGKAELVHLPKVGIKGNTHFLFSDLNNERVADHIANWLHEKGLD